MTKGFVMDAQQAEGLPKGPRKRKRLGDFLVDAGLIDDKVLSKALEIQKITRKKLGQVLLEMGVVDEQEIAKTLSRQFNIPLVPLDNTEIPRELIDLVPAEIAEGYLLVPVREERTGLLLAMANPLEPYAVDDVRFVTRMPIVIGVATQGEILRALEKYYPQRALQKDLNGSSPIGGAIQVIPDRKEEEDIEDIKSLTERPPVVRFVNEILADAIKLKASDIHIEPQKTTAIVRYRIDGFLRDVMQVDRHVHAPTVSRIKVISGMDISVRRKPQGGRCRIKHGEDRYDLRVSTIPTSYGEKVTLRILNPESAKLSLDWLGLSAKMLAALEEVISMPQGMLLVTRPTGSGKSSTLCACLNRLNTRQVNLVTVEDPVEFEMKGVNQVQINPLAGITFASGLRSILRQDPDIVMVGEIRDAETASIATQAAQTGHLVLSTLHTNDAPSAVSRLMDLGVEPFLIAASLQAVLGQRLVRKICENCKEPDLLMPNTQKRLEPYLSGVKSPIFWKGKGCEACQYTGYAGRTGIFEALRMTASLSSKIEPGFSILTLKKAAEREGFEPMFHDGIRKALEGLTTVEEVFRVSPAEFESSVESEVVVSSVVQETPEEMMFPDLQSSSVTLPRPKKILVATKSDMTRRVLRGVLEAESFLVLIAEDGAEAMRLILKEKPDLMVTDFLTPERDGLSLVEKLRSQLSTRYIPIIVLTPRGEEDSKAKWNEAGADDSLEKPVEANRLLAHIHRLLDRQVQE
ncbi:MAG: type secretion system protein (GspE) [Deltaproteobacteria bacterium]|nr:type secretion system protein (GspE) [Deltaproteobacteria bacterium]